MALVCVLSGSNIMPIENTRKAIRLLEQQVHVVARSRPWTTIAVGSEGPEFINMAFLVETNLELPQIKPELLAPIELQLGRKRSKDKNAPRTIDLDVIVYNDHVVDQSVWIYPHIALPVAELLPDLINPQGIHLIEVARQMSGSNQAYCCVELDNGNSGNFSFT